MMRGTGQAPASLSGSGRTFPPSRTCARAMALLQPASRCVLPSKAPLPPSAPPGHRRSQARLSFRCGGIAHFDDAMRIGDFDLVLLERVPDQEQHVRGISVLPVIDAVDPKLDPEVA